MKSSNNKVMTVTCLKCKKKVGLSDYTSKHEALLIKGICPKGCVTKENNPMRVAGFAKDE